MVSHIYGSGGIGREVAPGFLVFLPPEEKTRARIAAELAAAGVEAQGVGPGLRAAVGETDWRELLERVSAGLDDDARRDTRLAIVARDSDERSTRRALALARSLESLLLEYSDTWVHGLLKPGALEVYYQPLIEYPPGSVHGYECLVRGVAPDGGLIGSERIFEAAGRVGVKYLLDRQACRAAVLGAVGTGFASLRFFVNLLAGGVERPEALADSSLDAVRSGGLRPDQVVFEIVDAEAVCARGGTPSGWRHLAQVAEALKATGFSVALDELGTASPLLGMLADVPADYVKFDAAASRAAADNADGMRALAGACETAFRHGAITVAKGIENEEQLRASIDAGARLTQGFVHGPPGPTPLAAREEDQVLRQVRRTAILAFD